MRFLSRTKRSLTQLHTKKIARSAFIDTSLLIVVMGEPKNFTDAVCQNLSYFKFSQRFVGENLSIICSKLMLRSL